MNEQTSQYTLRRITEYRRVVEGEDDEDTPPMQRMMSYMAYVMLSMQEPLEQRLAVLERRTVSLERRLRRAKTILGGMSAKFSAPLAPVS